MLLNIFVVGLGGFVGSVLRYLAGMIPTGAQPLFPYKTMLINLVGCLAIGIVAAICAKSEVDTRLVLFIRVGLCGGFTTFSAFALESEKLLQSGHYGIAATYVALSIVLGIGAVIGMQMAIGARQLG